MVTRHVQRENAYDTDEKRQMAENMAELKYPLAQVVLGAARCA